MENPQDEQEFVTVAEAAARLGLSERTVWDVVRRGAVVRYRLPGQGKTTFVRWPDLERAYRAPRPIGPLPDGGVTSKTAA
ncbi:MAG: helix-turn-helix domain-containing protein [Chloroflexota bacterium]|nr:helix-turn-helix domain-containing protein [Chloroflexota bacterium]